MSIEFPYLIGIALIEENGQRAMPIGGKSIKETLKPSEMPDIKGGEIALELLIRVFQRSEKSPIQAIGPEQNILLMQISMETMQKELPRLKSEWLRDGNHEILINQLKVLTSGIWSLSFSKESGIIYKSLS